MVEQRGPAEYLTRSERLHADRITGGAQFHRDAALNQKVKGSRAFASHQDDLVLFEGNFGGQRSKARDLGLREAVPECVGAQDLSQRRIRSEEHTSELQ